MLRSALGPLHQPGVGVHELLQGIQLVRSNSSLLFLISPTTLRIEVSTHIFCFSPPYAWRSSIHQQNGNPSPSNLSDHFRYYVDISRLQQFCEDAWISTVKGDSELSDSDAFCMQNMYDLCMKNDQNIYFFILVHGNTHLDKRDVSISQQGGRVASEPHS